MEIFSIIGFIIFSFLIAEFLGKKRQISFGWSFFFCLFLSPLIGFFITIGSNHINKTRPKPSQTQRIAGILILLVSLFGGATQLSSIFNEDNGGENIRYFLFSIGFSGLGYYLYELGKGKTFNDKAKKKPELSNEIKNE